MEVAFSKSMLEREIESVMFLSLLK